MSQSHFHAMGVLAIIERFDPIDQGGEGGGGQRQKIKGIEI